MDTLTPHLAGLLAAPAVLVVIERSQYAGNRESAGFTHQADEIAAPVAAPTRRTW